jgi:hypothetical protein
VGASYYLGSNKEVTTVFLFGSRQVNTACTTCTFVALCKSPLFQESGVPDSESTHCTLLGTLVPWRGCHRFLRVRSGALVN